MNAPFFRPGDRWMAFGDSITEGGRYMAGVEYFIRCWGGRISFQNAGLGGDTSRGAVRRIDSECDAARPDVVTFFFGMNDVNRGLFVPGADPAVLEKEAVTCRGVFAKALEVMVVRCLERGLRVAVVSPPPFEHHPTSAAPDLPGVDDVLGQFSDAAAEVAARHGLPFVDLHRGMLEWIDRLRRIQPGGSLVEGDRVHPTLLGQLVMAVILHGALGARSVDRDALTVREASPLAFSVEPAGLPILWPDAPGVPREFREMLRGQLPVDVLARRDLPSGRYLLEADGEACGIFSHDAFHAGIPLDAVENFPTTALSRTLRNLLERKTVLQWEFRAVAWCDFMASEKTPRILDEGELFRILTEMRVERPYLDDAIAQRLANYSRLKADAAGHRERLDAVEKVIEAVTVPRAIACTLRRVD